jgi:hypothetical protein
MIISRLLPAGFFLTAAFAEVPVVSPPSASPAERVAARELAAELGRLYPADTFHVTGVWPHNGPAIVVGTPKSQPEDA